MEMTRKEIEQAITVMEYNLDLFKKLYKKDCEEGVKYTTFGEHKNCLKQIRKVSLLLYKFFLFDLYGYKDIFRNKE
jgi:hypothetical protein